MNTNLKSIVKHIRILDKAARGTVSGARLNSYQQELDRINRTDRLDTIPGDRLFVLDELQALIWYMRGDNAQANSWLKNAIKSKPNTVNFVSKAAQVWEKDYRDKYSGISSHHKTQITKPTIEKSKSGKFHKSKDSYPLYTKYNRDIPTRYRVKRKSPRYIYNVKLKYIKTLVWLWITLFMITLLSVGLFKVQLPPFYAFGGAVWLDDGPKYLSKNEISSRILKLNQPKENKLKKEVEKNTKSCIDTTSGFCKQTTDTYAYKILVAEAVPYQPGMPEKRELIGYCTVCSDGTFSPSCAVGRGACSWHGGVAQYNVPRYRTIPGTPEVKARPAIYSYSVKSYKDSPIYVAPGTPSLVEIVNSAQ
ncbi:hypothetical protein KC968_04310 [Candidatus Saccharibacteria bacterium]|nr:hypothetical protein [Candidatus Saccharibacteria bacterium]